MSDPTPNEKYDELIDKITGLVEDGLQSLGKIFSDALDNVKDNFDPRQPGNEPWGGGEDNGHDLGGIPDHPSDSGPAAVAETLAKLRETQIHKIIDIIDDLSPASDTEAAITAIAKVVDMEAPTFTLDARNEAYKTVERMRELLTGIESGQNGTYFLRSIAMLLGVQIPSNLDAHRDEAASACQAVRHHLMHPTMDDPIWLLKRIAEEVGVDDGGPDFYGYFDNKGVWVAYPTIDDFTESAEKLRAVNEVLAHPPADNPITVLHAIAQAAGNRTYTFNAKGRWVSGRR